MSHFFDDFDAEDFAFWGGFIDTQLEGQPDQQQEESNDDDPCGLEDALSDGEKEGPEDEEEW